MSDMLGSSYECSGNKLVSTSVMKLQPVAPFYFEISILMRQYPCKDLTRTCIQATLAQFHPGAQ
jgi:hypothetical protein